MVQQNETGLAKRFGWLIFGVTPTIALAAGIVLAAVATVVLDHMILGRDAKGWPVLYKTPLLRHAVDVFHWEIAYAAPAVLAVSFLAWGQRSGAAVDSALRRARLCLRDTKGTKVHQDSEIGRALARQCSAS